MGLFLEIDKFEILCKNYLPFSSKNNIFLNCHPSSLNGYHYYFSFLSEMLTFGVLTTACSRNLQDMDTSKKEIFKTISGISHTSSIKTKVLLTALNSHETNFMKVYLKLTTKWANIKHVGSEPVSLWWKQMAISTVAGFWDFKLFNSTSKKSPKNQPTKQKTPSKLKSNKQMRTSATESRNALWGHLYYLGFRSLDHSLTFCCFQIPSLHQNLIQTQTETPLSWARAFHKAAALASLSIPCYKVRKKILSNSKNIFAAASSFPGCSRERK